MIESMKDLKHGKTNSYEGLTLERTASQILHHMEDKDSEDSLESTRARVLCKFPYISNKRSGLMQSVQPMHEQSTERIDFST
jgi:hypothetical protein